MERKAAFPVMVLLSVYVRAGRMPTKEELQSGFDLGDWEVCPETGVIRSGDNEVTPEPQTWRVLIALAERDGGLVTKDDLMREVWDGRAVTDDPINRAIREVRKCFGDSAKHPTYVATLPKRGYRLLLPVRLHKPAASAVIESDIVRGPGKRAWRALAAMLVIGIASIMYLILRPDSPVMSIAILPFENLSGVAEDEYLVSGFKEELVTMLVSIDDLTVKPVRIDYDLEHDEIAKALRVDGVLVGAMRREGDEIRVSFQISKGQEGVIYSGGVEGNINELFATQERLAIAVRDELIGDSIQILITSRPSDSSAYDNYTRGMFALQHRGDGQNLEYSIELFGNAIELDKRFGPSYLGLATAYALMPDYRSGQLDRKPGDWNALAIETIDTGVRNDPSIENAAGSIYGFVYHKQMRWKKSEEAHLRAVNARVVDSNSFNWYSLMLASVGRMDAALEMALRAVEIDPSSSVINSRIAINYTWLQNSQKAHEYFQRADELQASGATHMLGNALLLARNGQLGRSYELTIAGVQLNDNNAAWVEAVFDAFADPNDPKNMPAALAAVNGAWDEGQVTPQVALVVRALLGDIDGAMTVAKLLESEDNESFEMELLFIPELQAMRQHPDFLPLLDRLNVTDYWAANNCLWSGNEVTCPDD